ncbi:hypothetical protein BDK51DRAFT_49418, partial [Blyttiomyces helicus]
MRPRTPSIKELTRSEATLERQRRNAPTSDSGTASSPTTTVKIGGITIETEDPSHLFWVPAHLHPEVHPTDFKKWLAKSADPAPAAASIFAPGITPLRRTKSFV